jgi:hypothetical protein
VEKKRLFNKRTKVSKKKIGVKSYSVLVMKKGAQIQVKIKKNGKR